MATDRLQPDGAARGRELVAKLCDGQLTANEVGELEGLVCRSDDLCRYYVLTVSLQADLYMQAVMLSPGGSEGWNDPDGAPVPEWPPLPAMAPLIPGTPSGPSEAWRSPGTRRIGRGWRTSLAAVLAVAAGAAVWRHHVDTVVPEPDGRYGRPAGVAVLDLSLNPAWVDGVAPGNGTGQVMAGDALRLRSGLARLTTPDGIDIILEGPAEASFSSQGRVRLSKGRLTAKVPHTAVGFAVDSPTATVTDLGTEFGVSVTDAASPSAARTDVTVFDGSVRVDQQATAGGEPGQVVRAGLAEWITSAGVRPLPVATTAGPFVRSADFDDRKRNVAAALAVVGHPDLLAYAFFDPDLDRVAAAQHLPAASPWRPEGGSPLVRADGPSIAMAGLGGRSLVTDGGHATFIDLDTSPSGRLARAGFVGPDGFIDVSGKTLYLSWLSTATSVATKHFGGVSLVDGEQTGRDEYLFIGKANGTAAFSCQLWRTGRRPVAAPGFQQQRTVNADPDATGPTPVPIDLLTHLWVVKVEFRPGNDVISVLFDPPADEPARANLSVDTIDLRFDKLRLTSGTTYIWKFGRVLVGSSYASVVPR